MFGPICTGIFLFISLWGTIFMGILGALFWNQSVGLFEDLPKEGKSFETKDWNSRVSNFGQLYTQNAYNCWVAAGVYVGLAVLLSLRACCLIKR